MNKNLQQVYRRILYNLKKQYGAEIYLCRNTSVSTNYETGVKEYTCSRTQINKAILLPTNFTRQTNYSLPNMSANKLFVFGGTYDVGSKIVVIDTRDLPEFFQITQDDWMLIDGYRFSIEKIEQLEHQAGWVIAGKQIMGMEADREVSLTTSDDIGLTDDASN